MQYTVYSRPKLPRNKYGFVNNSTQIGGGFSSYSSDGSSFNGDVSYLLDELQDFTGATQFENGLRGLVPAPLAGMQDAHFLKADGTWTYVPAYKWLHEWPEDNPRGLELDGDFNVTGMTTLQDLNVLGQAHFWELVIDRVKATGGQLIVSPSLFECDWVGGTQIYEVRFKSENFHWTYGRGGYKWYAGDDITQWICPNKQNPSVVIAPFSIRNIVEKDFTLEQFKRFCYTYGLFRGKNVRNDNSDRDIVGWGGYCTGFFEANLTDENGEQLPLTEGLPYDFDAHYMEYYHLWTAEEVTEVGPWEGNPDGSKWYELVFYYNTNTGYPRRLYYRNRKSTYDTGSTLMSDYWDQQFQSYVLSPDSNLEEEWNKLAVTRPDIWYRFFCDSIGTYSTYLHGTPGSELIDPSLPYPPATAEWNEAWSTWLTPARWPQDYEPVAQFAVPEQPNKNRYIQYFAKRLWMRCDDGSRRTFNECTIGDMLRCKSFNIKAGVYKNVSNKDFWTWVINTGEGTYTDDDGAVHEAFFVDLVYALKAIRKRAGHDEEVKYFPLGTVFKNVGETTITECTDDFGNGNWQAYSWDYNCSIWDDENSDIEFPSGWEQNMTQILNLKKVSKNTLCGLENVIEEFPTDEEFEIAVELISQIRGVDSSLLFVATGTIAGESSDEDTETVPLSYQDRMNFEQDFYGYQAFGDFPENNLWYKTQIILDPNKEIDSVEGSYYDDNTIDDANLESWEILSGGRPYSAIEEVSGIKPKTNNESSNVQANNNRMLKSSLNLNMAKANRGGEDTEEEESATGPITTETSYNNEVSNGRKLMSRENYHNYCSSEYYSQYKFGYGKWNVRTGDSFACLGNLYDKSRMNAIVISANTPIDPELVPPSIAQYHLIDRFGVSISTFRYTTIAKSGNTFFGKFNIDSGEGAYFQIDEKINFYITDIITGLETVGIHLDGPNSTIKMIGNIELHQHADGDDDTFSVWDSNERKRVEILPKEIPDRESQKSLLAQTEKRSIPNAFTSWTAPGKTPPSPPYVYYEETGSIVGSIFGNPRRANYSLNLNFSTIMPEGTMISTPFAFSCTGNASLGVFGVDKNTDEAHIDVSNLKLKIDISDAYLLYNGATERQLKRYIPIPSLVGENGYVSNLKIELLTSQGVVATTLDPDTGLPVPVTTTIAKPIYTTNDGKLIEVFASGIIFNDIKLNKRAFSPLVTDEYSLRYTIDVYPFCSVEDLPRAENRSFNGTASVVGEYTVTCDRRDESTQTSVSSSLSHMTIGTNGMVFNTSNSKHFYAADDGIEIIWEDESISFDDSKGLSIRYNTCTNGRVSGDYDRDNYDNFQPDGEVINPRVGTVTGVMLPDIQKFDLYRKLTVLAGWTNIRGYESTSTIGNPQQIVISHPLTGPVWVDELVNSTSWSWGTTTVNVMCAGAIELISTPGGWNVIGGMFVNSF